MTTVSSQSTEQTKISVLKNRNFLYLLLAALFSSPGYYVYLIGIEWLMLTINDNRFYFGMLFLAASIPRLILLTTGGIVADRFNKRMILFLSDVTRAFLIIILIFFIWNGSVTAVHLLILAALFGISDAFSYPALNSLTPMLVEKEQLQQGNSLIQMTTQISPILGPALGGSLIAWLGFVGVFTVACTMLMISAIAVLIITIKEKSQTSGKTTPWEDFKEGFKYARKHDMIITIVFMAFVLNFFFAGPLAIGIPIIIKDIFNSSVIGLAIVETSLGIGALLGAITLSIITLKKPGITMVSGLIVLGIAYLSTGLSTYLYITAVLVAIMGFMTQIVNIPLMTVLQQTTEKNMLGRMMGFLMTVSTGLVPVSYVVTSLLIAADISIQTIILTSGMAVTIFSLYQIRNKKVLAFSS